MFGHLSVVGVDPGVCAILQQGLAGVQVPGVRGAVQRGALKLALRVRVSPALHQESDGVYVPPAGRLGEGRVTVWVLTFYDGQLVTFPDGNPCTVLGNSRLVITRGNLQGVRENGV